jgi:cytoskeleton protein RodZ
VLQLDQLGGAMSVGQMIQSARTARGMSLDDLAQRTKLRASILSAMEHDDFSHCGGRVYARGQLRAMAPVLGLDPDDLVDEFDRGVPERPGD